MEAVLMGMVIQSLIEALRNREQDKFHIYSTIGYLCLFMLLRIL